MPTVIIQKGRDIPLKGRASAELKALPLPSECIFPFLDFAPRQFRLLIKEGDKVLVGSPIAEDREHPGLVLVSPVSGAVKHVNRGDKRALLSITLSTDGQQTPVQHQKFSPESLIALSRAAVVEQLLKGGVWPFLRQRPFSRTANPLNTPKSIFVRAMNTDPLAPDLDVILNGVEREFQAGLDVLKRLTPGNVYLCFDAKAKARALTGASHVESVAFSGPHPAGNVGTHIHHCDPVGKGDVVWFMEAQDVVRAGRLFLDGVFYPSRIIAVTGEGASLRSHVKTVLGASVAYVLGDKKDDALRYISGSVLSGSDVGYDGGVGLFDAQVTVIPAGGARKFFGWLMPMFKDYSFSRTVASALAPQRDVSLDTEVHGGLRAVVVNDLYDELNAIDVMTYFLIKAIYGHQIEEMIRLGILECAPEDFALATFACPSKVDVGAVIQRGLDMIEKEG